jgi:hypothetical protein
MGGMNWLFREPGPDTKLAAALRQMDAAPDTARGEDLRRRIMARVRPKLAERDVPIARWWEWLSSWFRIAVPVGLAASLAAAVILPRSGEMASLGSSTAEAGADSTLIVAAFSEPSAGGQLAAHLITPESNDWLLEQALSR